jgi:hypothetical protein
LIDTNPFVGVKIDQRSDRSKNVFVDAAMATAILEACPDQEWRTLFALARYGGLRCPSEVLAVRGTVISTEIGIGFPSGRPRRKNRARRVGWPLCSPNWTKN